MGIVYEAVDVALDRRVAVKVLRPEMATAVAAARFQREARLQARLKHPNVVTIHHVDEDDGLSYFIMDLVEGETLATRLERGPLSPAETLKIAHEVLAALGAAHEVEIIHRDVKPSNIFLGRRVMLADFGIARSVVTDGDEKLTTDFVGTPLYMAPEQQSLEEVTPATDLYSLGVVLYECLTKRSWKLWQDSASADWSNVPRGWVPALQRALASDPRNRWASASDFAAGLKRRRRRPWHALVAGGLLPVAGVALWLYLSSRPTFRSDGIGRAALPASILAMRDWNRGERFYFEGEWHRADTAYREAQARDSACVACDLRLLDLDRWIQRQSDTARWGRLERGRDRFEPPLRELIRAMHSQPPDKLREYRSIVSRNANYWLGQYYLGEELFNRGPLFGESRREAMRALGLTTVLQEQFVPVWYDLTFARIAAGDSARAHQYVRLLRTLPPTTGVAQLQRQLAWLAFAFRFTGEGRTVWQELQREGNPLGLMQSAAGPRVLMGLGTPHGAVELGEIFETEHPQFKRSGLIAQVLGLMSLGRPDSARKIGKRLVNEFPGESMESFTRTLNAATILLDEGARPEQVLLARSELTWLFSHHRTVTPDTRWLSVLAALRMGNRSAAELDAGPAGVPATGIQGQFTQSLLLADRGEVDQALTLTDDVMQDLSWWDSTERTPGQRSPLLRSGFKLQRARWYSQRRLLNDARSQLLWHQHFHMILYPSDEPITAEVDWAFGTLASWQLARALDESEGDADVCEAYRLVAERWREGEPRYRARADTARDRLQALQCVP